MERVESLNSFQNRWERLQSHLPLTIHFMESFCSLRRRSTCILSLGHLCTACEQIGSLRSKRSRSTRTKLGPREGVYSHSGCTKNEVRAKKWKERGGGGKRRSFPSPTPLLPPFCSRPIFRAARMRKPLSLGPNSSFASFGNACYAG